MISYWGVDHGAEISKARLGYHSASLVGAGVGGALGGYGAHHIMRATDPNFQKTVSSKKNRKKYIGATAGAGGVVGLLAGGPAGAVGGAAGMAGAAALATRKRRRRAISES